MGCSPVQVMICNVSPAKINADETLSSLRFAERAKKIENKEGLFITQHPSTTIYTPTVI